MGRGRMPTKACPECRANANSRQKRKEKDAPLVRCETCKKEFSGVNAFDAHRVGEFYRPARRTTRGTRHIRLPAQPNTRRCLAGGEMMQRDFACEVKNGRTIWYLVTDRQAVLQKSLQRKPPILTVEEKGLIELMS